MFQLPSVFVAGLSQEQHCRVRRDEIVAGCL